MRALLSGVDAVVVLQEHCLQYVSVRALLQVLTRGCVTGALSAV